MQHGIMTPLKDMKRCVLPAPLEGMQQNQRPTAVSIHCKATAAGKAETINNRMILNSCMRRDSLVLLRSFYFVVF